VGTGIPARPQSLLHYFRATIMNQKEEQQLRFEANGQLFFVNFVPEEGRWYCYAPTPGGIQRIPVSTDGAPFSSFMFPVDEQTKEVVN
jgi:hypothetical protein